MKRMINLVKKSSLLLVALTTASACNDFLEEQPRTQIGTEFFYQTESDALAALTAAYAQLKAENGYYRQLWLSNLWGASDQGASSWRHGDFRRGVIANTDPNLFRPWQDIYVAIRDANNVIAKVPAIEGIDEELQLRIEGEARFLRGLHYFNLVRAWGAVPLRTEPVQPGDYEGLPVSSVSEIMEVVIEDFQFAADHCWGKGESRNGYINNVGRATRAAAHAMLTKVYLRIASAKRTAMAGNQGNLGYLAFPEDPLFYYEQAKAYADLAIASPDHQLVSSLMAYVDIFDADNGNNAEMIFDIQGSNLTEQGTAVSNLFSPREAGLSGGGWGGTNNLVPRFVNNNLDKTDPRFINTIISEYQDQTRSYVLNPGTTGYIRTDLATGEPRGTQFSLFTGKYIDRSATTEYTSQQNWHVIRLADVHLMRAEAMAEIASDPAAANADFNILRDRVGMTPFDGAGMTMEDFRTAMLRERAAELYAEGHRFFDLTRLGVYDELCRVVFGETDGARGPEDYTWPIPIEEVAANENIN